MTLTELITNSLIFRGLDESAVSRIERRMDLRTIHRSEYLFHEQEAATHFYLVVSGLIKVYATSTNGTRMTYLIARRGEPLNLVSPFVAKPRPVVAQALEKSVVAGLPKDQFTAIAVRYPVVVSNIVEILGNAIDSSNSRIIDMMEKKVDERLFRALFSLYEKFGAALNFTSPELANLVGTTTESVLRSIGRLKKKKIIDSSRGKIVVLDPEALKKVGIESLWL